MRPFIIFEKHISRYSRVLAILFICSLLNALYFLFTLKSDLQFIAGSTNDETLNSVFVRLYIVCGVTAALALIALYAEMKNVKITVAYKDPTTTVFNQHHKTTHTTPVETLNSQKVAGNDTREMLTNALSLVARRIDGVAGACYGSGKEGGTLFVELISGFALPSTENNLIRYEYGEGLVGQAARNVSPLYIEEVPEGYLQVTSGLGNTSPRFILIWPLRKGDEVKGVIEVATVREITPDEKLAVEKFITELGEKLS